jgi:proline racemase
LASSIIDSRFNCRIEQATDLAGTPAIIPSISGRAWITETKQLMLDPSDPWPEGYRVGDTWPGL